MDPKVEIEAIKIRLEELTPRQMQVAELIAQGWGNKQICTYMVIAESSMKTHLNDVYKKLGLSEARTGLHPRVMITLALYDPADAMPVTFREFKAHLENQTNDLAQKKVNRIINAAISYLRQNLVNN